MSAPQLPKEVTWKQWLQEGLAVAIITSIFWVPLFGTILAVFLDGIFGTKIIETFKSLMKP